MSRDREKTRQRLIEAVGQVLEQDGFTAMGVNAVARAAGVDKALIYRYFNGFDPLLQAFAEQADLWWDVPEIIGEHLPSPARDDLANWCALSLERQVAALRARPMTREILAWELVEANALTRALDELRQERTRALIAQLTEKAGKRADTRLLAVNAVLSAAATYLVLRSGKGDSWLGADFAGDKAWQRLDTACGGIARAVLADVDVPATDST